ncbi:MAG: hypothetical protein J6129_02555 [Bacteroidaceae bacterium]|nr:hypothetical protein [Bacteroidaceae bacterium]
MKTRFRGGRLLLAIAATALALQATAQSSGTNSPYSRYGFGILNDEAMGFNKGMAGVAMGMRDPNIINRQNPASYSEMDSLRFLFDVGVSLQTSRLRESGRTVNANNSTLDYLAAAFRLRKDLGFSLGLRPLTTIGYDFNSTTDMADLDGLGAQTTTSTYSGNGGLHELYGGLGWQPLKGVSIGGDVKYIWGDYSHSSSVTYSETSIQTLRRSYSGRINSLNFDIGVQAYRKIGKKDRIVVGATYAFGHMVNQSATFINTQNNTSSTSSADTVTLKNAFRLPSSGGIGISWNHDYQWTVGLDYTLQRWSRCKFPELRERGGTTRYIVGNGSFQDRHRIAAGVEFVPNPRGLKVRDHICYRAGVAYSTPYAKVNGEKGPKSFLVSAGAAFPIVNRYTSHSVLNVSAQWEHMQASTTGALKEDYLRLCVGLTFSARWFEQWKVR